MTAAMGLGVLLIVFGVLVLVVQFLFGDAVLVSAQEVELWALPLVTIACWLSPRIAARLHVGKRERKPRPALWNALAVVAIMVLAEFVIFRPVQRALDHAIIDESDWVKLIFSRHISAIEAAIAISAFVGGVLLILESRRLRQRPAP
jgi:hypothetical protein